jgi:hypothetical protein
MNRDLGSSSSFAPEGKKPKYDNKPLNSLLFSILEKKNAKNDNELGCSLLSYVTNAKQLRTTTS